MTRILISLLIMLFLPATAAASPFPPVINGTGPSLHPEGVTYNPIRGEFLVGSVTHGTVSRVVNGKARTLVDDPWLITTMGIAVDARRGRLLVTNADLGLADRSKP